MFSCQICEIFKNTYLEEHLRTTASKRRSSFLEVFCRNCCSALINAVMKYSFSAAVVQSWRVFHENCTPSQAFFKKFHYSCRTGILRNVSWLLLLRANLFLKHSCMAASQKQPQTHFVLETWRHVKEELIFVIFFK